MSVSHERAEYSVPVESPTLIAEITAYCADKDLPADEFFRRAAARQLVHEEI